MQQLNGYSVHVLADMLAKGTRDPGIPAEPKEAALFLKA
jgi:hypothetical protein